MRTPVFTGSCCALATPFDQNGNINYDAFGRLIDAQIAAGVDAVCVCGTTGESATMSIREHIAAVEFCVKRVDHRVKVIAGAGSNDTSAAVYLSQHAEDSGADALLHVTPYYNKCSQEGLLRHYFAIAEQTALPIILYNVPGRTGVNLLPATAARLAEHPRLAAIKEASGNISQIAETIRLTRGRMDIYSGNDDQTLPILALGGKGVISVSANVIPRIMHDICALYLSGKMDEARDLFLEYNPLNLALFTDVNPIPVKTALNHMGFAAGPLRLPLCEMSQAAEAALTETLRRYALI